MFYLFDPVNLIGMNGSMPRTRKSRNSTDSPLTKPMVSDLGFEIRDAVFGEMTCTTPACGFQCYSKKRMLAHIAERHGTKRDVPLMRFSFKSSNRSGIKLSFLHISIYEPI